MFELIVKNKKESQVTFRGRFPSIDKVHEQIRSAEERKLWGRPALKLTEEELGKMGLTAKDAISSETSPLGTVAFSIPAEYDIVIRDITEDPEFKLEQCHQKRRAEYPTLEELVVALFEQDQQAIMKLQERRQAVKAKYPKP